MIAVIHPHGNTFVRQTLQALHERQWLGRFHTSLGFASGQKWMNLVPAHLRRELHRRSYELPPHLIDVHPWREIARHCSTLLPGLAGLARHERGWASVDQVYQALDRRVAHALSQDPRIRAVHAYEDGAAAVFAEAQKLGLARHYDLPIAYWRRARNIFAEEADFEPDWAPTLTGLSDSEAKLERKDDELRRASQVFAASGFTARSLEDFPEPLSATITVVPYGAPPAIPLEQLKQRLHRRARSAPLRVLFVGGLSQRKGLSYLFRALAETKAVARLTVVGRPTTASCRVLERELAAHTYIPSLDHGRLLELMHEHDILVLPSLFEGFGLVLLEAMAQGLPVIATPHTAAPDFLTSGRDGFIVPIRDSDAIAAILTDLANHREKREACALSATTTATAMTWEHYREGIVRCSQPCPTAGSSSP